MSIITIGLDLAKNVLAVHGVDATAKAALIKSIVKRDALVALIAKMTPCLIGMEAYTSVSCRSKSKTLKAGCAFIEFARAWPSHAGDHQPHPWLALGV